MTDPITPEQMREALDRALAEYIIGIDRASAFRRVNFQPHFLILSTDGRHSANCNGVTNNDARR